MMRRATVAISQQVAPKFQRSVLPAVPPSLCSGFSSLTAEWPISAGVQGPCTAEARWADREPGQLHVPCGMVPGAAEVDVKRQQRQQQQQQTFVGDETSEEHTELMLRISRLIEDDPALATNFARSLHLDAAMLRRIEAICKEAEKADICPPTTVQLKQVCMASALPFLGFGILDNAVMIVFGDMIDLTLCATFGFSTMAAAALGNTLSDGFGVFSGGVVEDMAAKAGFEAPPLSRAQQALASTKRWERLGQLLGITVGCLIGMFPLLLINWKDQEAQKRQRALEHMYDHVVVAVEDMLNVEAAVIAFVDEEKQELYSRSAAHHGSQEFEIRIGLAEGILGRVASTGHFLNIADIRAPESNEYYVPQIHDDFGGTGVRVRSVLCMPVFGYNSKTGHCDKVVGVVGVVNKKDGGHFTEKDEDALAALCSHISTSLSFVHGEEHGFDETLERCSRALRTKGTRINSAANQRVHDLYTLVLQEVCKLIEVDFAELLSIDSALGQVQSLATSTDDLSSSNRRSEAEAEGCRRLEDMGIVAQVASKGRPCIKEDDGTVPATLCCPLFDGNREVIGAIKVIAKAADRRYSDENVKTLERVANRVSLTMEGTGSSLTRLLSSLQAASR